MGPTGAVGSDDLGPPIQGGAPWHVQSELADPVGILADGPNPGVLVGTDGIPEEEQVGRRGSREHLAEEPQPFETKQEVQIGSLRRREDFSIGTNRGVGTLLYPLPMASR